MARPRSTQRRLLGFVKPYRLTVAVAVVACAMAAAAAAFYAYLIGPLLKAVLTGEAARLGPLSLERADLPLLVPLLVLGVALVKSAAQFLQSGLMQATGQKVMADIRGAIHARLLELPPSFYEHRHSGELLSRFTSDVAQV